MSLLAIQELCDGTRIEIAKCFKCSLEIRGLEEDGKWRKLSETTQTLRGKSKPGRPLNIRRAIGREANVEEWESNEGDITGASSGQVCSWRTGAESLLRFHGGFRWNSISNSIWPPAQETPAYWLHLNSITVGLQLTPISALYGELDSGHSRSSRSFSYKEALNKLERVENFSRNSREREISICRAFWRSGWS